MVDYQAHIDAKLTLSGRIGSGCEVSATVRFCTREQYAAVYCAPKARHVQTQKEAQGSVKLFASESVF